MGMFVPRSILRRRPAESLNPAGEEDLDRLAELRERGSRLNLPHPVRGFVQFESERAARSGADALRRAGFACTVRAAGDGSWVVTAVRTLVPTPGAVTRLREELESLTAGQDGSYRGWDAPIVC